MYIYIVTTHERLLQPVEHTLFPSPPYKLFEEGLVVERPLHMIGLFKADISFFLKDKEDQERTSEKEQEQEQTHVRPNALPKLILNTHLGPHTSPHTVLPSTPQLLFRHLEDLNISLQLAGAKVRCVH